MARRRRNNHCKYQKNLEDNIEVLKTSGSKYGLEVNEQKSKVLHVRGTEKTNEVGNFEVVGSFNYLGINLGGKGRDIFRAEKRGWLRGQSNENMDF